MLLEQCRPLHGGRLVRAVFVGCAHLGRLLQLDGSQSAGTTSPEAGLGRVRRFGRRLQALVLSKASSILGPHPRPTLPGFRLQRASCSLQRHG